MDANKIKAIIAAVLAIFVALYLGIAAATAQLETIMWVLGAGTLIVCLLLGKRIWLLIPFMAALSLSLRLPSQPTSLLLGQALVIGFSMLLFLMRKLPFQLAWTELEFWVLILTLFLAQVYMRNPVGINLFGGETVGGRGYVLYAIALFSTLLLSGLRTSPSELKLIMPLSILGGLINTAVSIAGLFSLTVGYYTGTGGKYLESTDAGFDAEVIDQKSATRIGFLSGFANNLSLWISSYISPMRACLQPLWAILILIAIIAAGMSGFRNVIVTVGMTFLLGIIYRSGFIGVAGSLVGGIGGLALLAVVNTLYPLPPNIQRSLTFLPGTWDQRYKLDAETSSDWRYEIWREALLTDRWIRNKWLGDGLGFSATELAAQMNAREGTRAGVSGFEGHRETILANGDYHSGPVSTIRVIGYVGLFFLLLAQIRLAVHAHRQILRCKGTEWLPLALFLGIPVILSPIIFVLIFGDFKTGAASFLLSLGMIRLLENNLPLPAYVKHGRMPYVLQSAQAIPDIEKKASRRLRV